MAKYKRIGHALIDIDSAIYSNSPPMSKHTPRMQSIQIATEKQYSFSNQTVSIHFYFNIDMFARGSA